MTFIVPPSGSAGTNSPLRPAAAQFRLYSVAPGARPVSSAVGAASTIYILPFYLVNVDRINQFYIPNISGGASTVRIALYENDGSSRPGALINDFGTGTANNGQNIIINAGDFPAPFTGWFFVGYKASQFTHTAINQWPFMPTALNGLSREQGSIIAGTAGAFPVGDPFPADLTGAVLTIGSASPFVKWVAG